jgi:hypothetical protein
VGPARRARCPWWENHRTWAEDQFHQLGRRDARELAINLFAGVQGGALLANAFRDPDIMTGQVRHVER